ncbi:LysM peptidoglycan-binding domain-containing protein [Lactiplantibacillus plantarum]|uniref:LysM peptidoglycan-binding domain-containing protein n=1 Tax=Lactiplantibacillus plantarum TaxID=1590 RepID=UPI001F4D269D|nr:LysM peptidoglycan-binding domain-containing protein [Lactiplantibacillus plantarum]MCH8623760.1 LysM peptidoglycan-binding domain-containing protein [Lactiplantibacillus plantarum]MCH8629890.1 LysM peptidoglycan-binding domain-containing protein [Lactiplantibacillus plantarum]MCH8633133.1 LysM peptidoglycan-binding domain-containing protein [Lactiplantibacillus plantarum]
MKKLLTTILTTSAATVGLLLAGTVSAHADATYTVKKGDCVWAISQEYKTTIESIETANNIHGHLILPGQQLRIPGVNAQDLTSQAPATTPATESYSGDNLQSYVLGQMQARTGVDAGTWNHIINRESNWQPHVVNGASGAYGLFQNIHISGGSVQQQIDAAVSLYHAQGMQAWALY